jgi:AraC-like DNA-binding protein
MLRNYVNDPRDPRSLSPHPVNAMRVEPDGTLWVGTVEGGLNRRVQGGFEHWTTHNSGLTHNSVSVLEGDGHGRLWIGTWGGGVNTIDNQGETITIRPLAMPDSMVGQTNYIGALAYDRRHDALWIGSNDGVFLYNLKTGRLEDPFEGNREIRGCIGSLIDHEQQLWMGCLSGVIVIDLKSDGGIARGGRRFRVRHLRHKLNHPESPVVDKITCFCEAKDGTLWLGSNGYGLYRRCNRLEARNKKGDGSGKMEEAFEVLTTDDGLANNSVKGIVEDMQGRLWITTNNGLSIYTPDTHTFTNYGEREGLSGQQFYWNSAVKGSDGAIYVGSTAGLTEIRGENSEADYPVHLTFTQLLVDNQEVTSADEGILDADISQARCIRLHESNKSFAISFSTLTYEGDVQGHYSYRMKGFDDEWTILTPGEHSVRYTSLKPGTYTFEVAYAAKGSDNRHVISIDIVVKPYFWKSWWFVIIVTLAVAALLLWQLRQRMEKLRRQEAEKLMVPIRKAMDEADDPEQLQARIQNILDAHEHLKKSYRRSVEADKQESLQVKTFMERATATMEQHYMDSTFGITEFAEAMGMSRSLLAKRLNAETGQSTGQFIRNYRLTVAKKLLLENIANRNITEIAYKVGFNDPKYFTRCFTHRYGKSPSTYVEEDTSVD